MGSSILLVYHSWITFWLGILRQSKFKSLDQIKGGRILQNKDITKFEMELNICTQYYYLCCKMEGLVCNQYHSINWEKRATIASKIKPKTTANNFPNWQKAERSKTSLGSIACWNKQLNAWKPTGHKNKDK